MRMPRRYEAPVPVMWVTGTEHLYPHNTYTKFAKFRISDCKFSEPVITAYMHQLARKKNERIRSDP